MNEPVSFFSILELEQDDGYLQSAMISNNLDAIKKDIETVAGNDNQSEEVGDSDVNEEQWITQFGVDIWHFYKQLRKYYELSYMSSRLKHVFVSGYFKNVIKKHAEDNLEVVDSHNNVPIYGLKDHQVADLNKRLLRYQDINHGVDIFSPAVLLSIVASYDSLFSDLSKNLLKMRPERYHSSDRQYQVSDLLALSSFEGLIEKVINDEVDSLMNRSHADQVTFFEKSFSVKVKEHFSSWPEYIEIFERRNLAAHGGLCVNDRYISNCSKNGMDISEKIGDVLVIDYHYLNRSLDVLIEFGTILIFSAWQKQLPDQKTEAFQTIINVSYDLLKSKRFSVAENIITYVMKGYAKHASESIRKMLCVNLAIAQKKQGREADCKSTIDSEDWTASSPIFKLCSEAVRGDAEAVAELIPVVHATKEMTPQEFREWPALDWIRQDAKVQQVFEKSYAQSLLPSGRISRVESSQGADEETESGKGQ